ncbi:MAG: DNA-processing protein DprA [Actinomycetota bacterium]|nr:DNA-processing protein DprA [Actinomycetota bacterium]
MREEDDLFAQLRGFSAAGFEIGALSGEGTREDPNQERQGERPLDPKRTIDPGDPEWPDVLCELQPGEIPKRLYVEGRRLEVDKRTVAVVGTRRPTAAGVEAAEELTRGLVEAGCTIVSGLAVGIDTIAHRTALELRGYTIAVLGCGLDVDYPARNAALKKQIRATGTLVSEYPDGVQPHAHHFPLRNRIVAGLAQGILVIEGGVKSGALITARLGIDANRDIWALPGSVRNPMSAGPHELIRSGHAKLTTRVDHMFEDLAPGLVWDGGNDRRAVALKSLSADEAAVLAVLDDVPVAPDRIVRLTGQTPGSVALSMSRLEVRGLAVRRRGGYEISGAGARLRRALEGDGNSVI